MKASVRWINRLLDHGGKPPLSAEEIDAALTNAAFTIDAHEPVAPGTEGAAADTRLEVEVTSNRGDCLSHVGLAREVAACTQRRLKMPVFADPPAGEDVHRHLTLRNESPDACPRFTARVIRGVRIGPSPAWLIDALAAVGQRSINNIVDITNYLTFEYGQPAHAFDLARLAGRRLIVRWATAGEKLTTLDGKARTLRPDELVVADAERAQSLAGVIGGADSEVGAGTTDVVLEAATWDPAAVRRAARRHGVRTDASHRFERLVDPRTIDLPARHAAALIVELAGGSLCAGALDEGAPPRPLTRITLRPARCRGILGVAVSDAEIAETLGRLEIGCERLASSTGTPQDTAVLRCTAPAFRPDLTREIDLIEEVARIRGLDAVPIHDRLLVAVRPPQASEAASRELANLLVGLGFYETVTFTFISRAHAAMFLPPGMTPAEVNDDRRKAEPALRPSILPSLLACRRANQFGQVHVPGGVRLFEAAAVFMQDSPSPREGVGGRVGSPPQPPSTSAAEGGLGSPPHHNPPQHSPPHHGPRHHEARRLALLMDLPGDAGRGGFEEKQAGVRGMRGVLEAAVRAMGGANAPMTIVPAKPPTDAFDPAAYATVAIDGRAIGGYGLISPSVQAAFDLATPVIAAELALEPVIALYPPRPRLAPLPQFPAIERDLSLVVDEGVPWADIESAVREAASTNGAGRMEGAWFVGTYRGKQAGPGKKSVTLRVRFRDPARTLTHDEVDGPVAALVALCTRKLGATLRQ